MVNFNIIEGKDNIQEKIDEFIRLYNLPEEYTVKDIERILNISHSEYKRLRSYAIDFCDLKPRRARTMNPRYYSKNRYGTFEVTKYVNSRYITFGTYKTEDIAKQIVKELIKVDWDKNELERIQKEVL